MKFLSLLAILFGFSQCGSTTFVKKPPFSISKATYTNWVGGVRGVSGTRVEIMLNEKSTATFNALYFQNKKVKVEVKEENNTTFIAAHFNTSTINNINRVLHSDAKMEINNSVPIATEFPFKLKDNEAVVSYTVGTKSNYYKLIVEEKTTTKYFPSLK